MNTNLPEHVYKFQTFSKEHITALHNNEVWFATSSTFNDPFDSNTKSPLVWFTEESFIKSANSSQMFDPIKIQTEMAKKRAELLSPEHQLSTSTQNKKVEIKILLNETYIFCLSSNNTNHILWAHYANKHKGFCIKYNTKKLIDSIKLVDHDYVKYSNAPIDFLSMSNSTKNETPLREIFFKKSEDWKYEKEYRLIHDQLKSKNYKDAMPDSIDPKAIEAVIFGMESCIEDRIFLMSILKGRNISFRQMISNDISYNLTVSDQELNIEYPFHK